MANIKFATTLAARVQRSIANNTFNFEEFFPESKFTLSNPTESTRFSALADAWINSQGRLAEATQDQYRTAIRFWKKLLGPDTELRTITHKFLALKIGSYPWPSARTHNNYLIALRGILAREYRGEKTLHNPIIGIENQPVIKTLPDPFSTDERDTVLKYMREQYDPRVNAYFLWMFFTGMRPEEAIALRWSDVDFNRQSVRIKRVRTFNGTERDGSKTNSEREVDLLPQAMQALSIMKSYTGDQVVNRSGDPDTSADIFQNPVTSRPWRSERSQRDIYLRPCLKALRMRWRPAYNTRHTFATAALMTGAVPPAYIAAQLGHSVKMLLEKYARWLPVNDKGNAKAMLAAAMGGTQ